MALGACGVVAVLGLGMLLADRMGPTAFSQVPAAVAAASGVVVTSAPLPDNEVMICILDTARQRLAVYVADAKRTRLKLLAVRDISADWSLTDWNNDPPLPKDVRARADKAAESARPAPEVRKPEETP